MYSFDDLGVKATNAVVVNQGMTINYHTADNSAVGNVTVTPQVTTAGQHGVTLGNPSGMDIDLSANNMAVPPSAGFSPVTVDLQLLQDYLQDHINAEEGYVLQPINSLSGDLLDPSFDPSVAAMENVISEDVNTGLSVANNPVTEVQQVFKALGENTWKFVKQKRMGLSSFWYINHH